jgi:membrane-associated phospholipid phosphatase
LILLQLLVSALACRWADRPLFVGVEEAYGVFWSTAPLAALGLIGVSLIRRRHASTVPLSFTAVWRSLRREHLTRARACDVVLMLGMLPLSLAIFSAAKRTIPILHPFAFDRTLDTIERVVHGGRRPWEWLQPFLSHPALTVSLDVFYHQTWPVVIAGATILAILLPAGRERTRFLVATVLVWLVVGTLAALLFSSAGPPYFAAITGNAGPYGALMVYLNQVDAVRPLLSVGGHRALWAAYQQGTDAFGFGISAMPSVHVASSTLLAMAGWSVHRVLGSVLGALAALTLLASVALGWHYAIDGYAGVLLAGVIWWGSGRISRKS